MSASAGSTSSSATRRPRHALRRSAISRPRLGRRGQLNLHRQLAAAPQLRSAAAGERRRPRDLRHRRAGAGAQGLLGAYAATKAALETLVRVYADEVASTKIRANLIDPGRLRTALRARAYPGEKPESLPAPESVAEAFVALAEPACARHGELIVASKEGDHR